MIATTITIYIYIYGVKHAHGKLIFLPILSPLDRPSILSSLDQPPPFKKKTKALRGTQHATRQHHFFEEFLQSHRLALHHLQFRLLLLQRAPLLH